MLLSISFFPNCFFLLFLVWSYFLFPFLHFFEFYSELYLLFFFSILISSLLVLLLISYFILPLLSHFLIEDAFGGFVPYVLVLFVWPICTCCCLWFCSIASISYNLFFALLAMFLLHLLAEWKVFLMVDWIFFKALPWIFSSCCISTLDNFFQASIPYRRTGIKHVSNSFSFPLTLF